MAGIAEISIGIATVLGASQTPEPLYVELRGQTVSEAVLLVRRVIDECSDGEINLGLVTAPKSLLDAADFNGCGLPSAHRGVPIRGDDRIESRIEFYRHNPADHGSQVGAE